MLLAHAADEGIDFMPLHALIISFATRNARSIIFPLEVDGRFDADALEIDIEPFLGTRAT